MAAPAAVIFDCDGTLVDSERLGNTVLVELLGEHGVGLTVDDSLRRFRGRRFADTLAEIERDFGVHLADGFAVELRQRVALAFSTRLQPIDGAAGMLQALRLPRAVASNGPPHQLELSLRVTGLIDHFGAHIYSAYEVGSWKPDPGLFLHAARRLGVRPASCLVVEDSAAGIAAARAAGIEVVAYCAPGHRIEIEPAVPTISHLSELQAYF
jgi:HAD superfamily hydrolase (TIGR01509 family)